MQYQHARTTATFERMVYRIAFAGISLTLVTVVIGLLIQDAKATSVLDPSSHTSYLRDGVLKDAIAPNLDDQSDQYLDIAGDGVLKSERIQFEEDNWLLVDPAPAGADQTMTQDSAWMQFIEQNTLLPDATSTSALARHDTADHIAALGSDVIDFSLGIDYYRTGVPDDEEADRKEIARTAPKSNLRMQ